VAAKPVAAAFVADCGGSAGKSRFPTSSEQSKKWPVRSSPSLLHVKADSLSENELTLAIGGHRR